MMAFDFPVRWKRDFPARWKRLSAASGSALLFKAGGLLLAATVAGSAPDVPSPVAGGIGKIEKIVVVAAAPAPPASAPPPASGGTTAYVSAVAAPETPGVTVRIVSSDPGTPPTPVGAADGHEAPAVYGETLAPVGGGMHLAQFWPLGLFAIGLAIMVAIMRRSFR